MTIVRIVVARLINTGNYENTRIEWTADLDAGEDPAGATIALGSAVAQACEREHKAQRQAEEQRWARASAGGADVEP